MAVAPVDVLFLNGWSFTSGFTEPYVQQFAGDRTFHIEDISSDHGSVDGLEHLLAYLHKGTAIVGWSLGGMLAIRLAFIAEARGVKFSSLVCLAAAPVFVGYEMTFQGMSHEAFAQFEALAKNPEELVKQFPFLITQGTQDQRKLLREVRAAYGMHVQTVALRDSSLVLLRDLDVNQELEGLNAAILFVFGEQDSLISKRYVEQLRSRWASKENIELVLLPGVSHFPFVATVAELLRARLVCWGDCEGNTAIRDASVK